MDCYLFVYDKEQDSQGEKGSGFSNENKVTCSGSFLLDVEIRELSGFLEV